MTGAEFAAAGHALARAYARLRPGGAEWLAAWQADDPAAADELHEWELEGHPFTQWSYVTMNTIQAVAAVAALISDPSRWAAGNVEARDAAGAAVEATSESAVAWSIGGAITRVIDPDAAGITDAEWRRRTELEVKTYRRLGITTERADGGLVSHATVLTVLSCGSVGSR